MSIRAVLAALVVAALVPILALSGVLLQRYASAETRATEVTALDIARQATLAVDREIAGVVAAVEVLATSDNLDTDDLAGFYLQAAAARAVVGMNIVLRRPDGQQMVNLRFPFGTALPQTSDRDVAEKVVEQRQRFFSNLIKTPGGEYALSVTVPVIRGGRVVYTLSLGIAATALSQVLREQRMPDGWVLSAIDRADVIIGRNRDNTRFVGEFATDDLRQVATGGEGIWKGRTKEGQRVVAAYARSATTGWRMAVGGPEERANRAFLRSVLALATFGAAALCLSLAGAFWLARLIAGPLRSMAAAGPGIAHGRVPDEIATSIHEVGLLNQTLREAAATIAEREGERDAALDDVRRLNQGLEERIELRTRELTALNESLMDEVRQRESAEAKVQHLQRLEAVGQLTGGIAHDFNNMLAIVISSLSLMRRRLDRNDFHIQPLADAAMEGAGRAAALTQRLLAFSRQQPLALKAMDVHRLLDNMADLLHRTLGEDVRVEFSREPDLWPVHADESQLENALLNLAVNARDAMPGGGRLTIETENVTLDDAYVRENGDASPGDHVMIAVSDTGSGMSPDVVARAFEPFFTTKGVGKGTGLGLSQIYGYVRQSGGHVKIFSKLGAGTTVKVYLPRYRGVEAVAQVSQEGAGPLLMGTESILLVEDDAKVRAATLAALSELGYEVLEASGAARALRILDARPDIALLFTDIVMPDMDGRELVRRARKSHPDLKVLFTTGYARPSESADASTEVIPVLHKPFDLVQLSKTLREVIDDATIR